MQPERTRYALVGPLVRMVTPAKMQDNQFSQRIERIRLNDPIGPFHAARTHCGPPCNDDTSPTFDLIAMITAFRAAV